MIVSSLGAGLLYIPSLALVGVWFDKKRAVAMGIVMSGIAVGKYHFLYSYVWDIYLQRNQAASSTF